MADCYWMQKENHSSLIKVKLCQYSLTQRNETIMFHWKKLAQTGLDSPPPSPLKPL